MKTLKIPTHWTPEQAACIDQFLDEFKEAIWQSYEEQLVPIYMEEVVKEMHQSEAEEQLDLDWDFNDEIPL